MIKETKKRNFDLESYKQELEYIYNQFPMYQQVGRVAYKPGIEGMVKLDQKLGSPHKKFKSVHIAGTNGKGSVSHMIASALQSCGLKTGLYTSPHLTDFRERIKVDGQMVSMEYVYDFLTLNKEFFLKERPSFFEISTALAFSWFAKQEVDVAVIETGLGGRLDSTNILTPMLSIITNIGLDHCEHLGFTLGEIAREKAGIIKPGVPVVIGEAEASTRNIFKIKAKESASKILFAQDYIYKDVKASEYNLDLLGDYQNMNIRTVLTSLAVLGTLPEFVKFFDSDSAEDLPEGVSRPVWSDENIRTGLSNAAKNTGLRGRWEIMCTEPKVICDTGHNAHGLKHVFEQLRKEVPPESGKRLFIILGFVADKDLAPILGLLPENAFYIFTQAQISRALNADELAKRCFSVGLEGEVKHSVKEAVDYFCSVHKSNDVLFIGGSTYIVAEAITYLEGNDALPHTQKFYKFPENPPEIFGK